MPLLTPQQLQTLQEHRFVILDDFLNPAFYLRLKKEAEQQSYRDAQITHGLQQNVRSDGIAWIEKDHTDQTQGNEFVGLLEQMVSEFNQAFFVGIRRTEAHFAKYTAGKFYAKHVDNPKGKNNRVFSCVFYMNDDWQAVDGGELMLYTNTKNHTILPINNRMIIFDSNLEHEVKPATRSRLSIACWLRRDGF